MMLHTKYQGSGPCGFRREDFSCFLYISLCKICNLHCGASFGPRGISSRPCVSDKNIFKAFISKIYF